MYSACFWLVTEGKRELNELGIEKEKMENCFRVEQSKCIGVIEEKGK